MHANLILSARDQSHIQERVAGLALVDDAVKSRGMLGFARTLADTVYASELVFDQKTFDGVRRLLGNAFDDRVVFFDRVFPFFLKFYLNVLFLGKNDQTRRVAIEAMHDIDAAFAGFALRADVFGEDK